ncbi:MAG: hypothetical protein H6559_26345 [Lewinellaceae bacterium]|nr:hypothetical protein [Lewinellaceae bacterium]
MVPCERQVVVTVPNTLCGASFTYQVCPSGGTALTRWVLELPNCITAGDIQTVYVNGQPTNNWNLGTDAPCGLTE